MARCLALLGMVATHVLIARGPDGDLALPQAIAGGRAAALFAATGALLVGIAARYEQSGVLRFRGAYGRFR